MIYGYIRTGRNNEEQITEQREAIVNWAKKNRLKVGMYIAEYGNGLQINKGLQFILDNLKADDMLIITNMSRLSRDLQKCMALMKSIEDSGVELIELDHSFDGFDALQIHEFVRRNA